MKTIYCALAAGVVCLSAVAEDGGQNFADSDEATVDTRFSYDTQGVGENPAEKLLIGDSPTFGELLTPAAPPGYVFGGWWTVKDGREIRVEPGTPFVGSDDYVLLAQWDGENRGYATVVTKGIEVRLRNALDPAWEGEPRLTDYGCPYGALPELTAEGYWADGWWTAADRARGVRVTADTRVSIVGDHTLYALWTARPVPDPAAETTVTVREGLCVTIPNAWFAAHGLAGDDLAAVALSPSPGTDGKGKADAAGNTVSVWQDYVAGTDPNDSDDTLLAEIEMVDGKPLINWRPSMNGFDANGDSIQTGTRHYRIWGKETLSADEPWRDTDVTPGDYRFFRVTVEMRK